METKEKKKGIREILELLSLILIICCAIYGLTPLHSKPVKDHAFSSAFKYTGMIDGKYPHGKGELHSSLGSSYKGNFSEGYFSGSGLFLSKDGWSYEGNFKKGLPQGGGVIRAKNGIVWKSKDGKTWEKIQGPKDSTPEEENSKAEKKEEASSSSK